MTRLRVILYLLTIVIVGSAGFFLVLYAQGYRLNKNNKLTASGLLVANSDPTGAQILINGELNSATNATISLTPGEYDLQIKKSSYISWGKKIKIDQGIVTEIDASLFPEAASLNPLTFAGATNPQISPDYSKIVYGAADGIWVIQTINLPLGFNSEPTKITDLVPDAATTWQWSPDSRQILVTTKNASYLLDIFSTTAVNQLADITATLPKIKLQWQDLQSKQLASLMLKLPEPLRNIFQAKAKNISFSPDQTKILYTGSNSGSLPTGVVPQLPGSSTQKEMREIKKDKTYVYDMKEDRNFEITDVDSTIYWFPTSRNLLIPQKEKIVIADYDNTNKQTVYGGSYVYPIALPTPNINRIFILTNLGAAKATPNLYSLNLR